MSQVLQPSFAAGELSPSLTGRIDLAKYQTGLATCRNFIVQAYGGVVNRPGTLFCGNASNHSVPEFLMPFQWGDGQNYVLALGDKTLRIYKNGAPIVYPAGHERAGQIVQIATPWSASDTFSLHYAQSADVVTVVHPKYMPYQIKRYDHHEWLIEAYDPNNGPFEDVNTDVSKVMTASGTDGTITLETNFDLFSSTDIGRAVYFELQDYGNYKSWQSGVETTLNDVVVSNSKIYRAVALAGGTTRTGGAAPDHDEGYAWDGSGRIEGQFSYGVRWQYLCSAIGIAQITAVANARQVTAQVQKSIASYSGAGSFASMSVESIGRVGSSFKYQGTTYNADTVRVTVTRHGLGSGQRVTLSGAGFETYKNWSNSNSGRQQTLKGNGTYTVYVADANNFYLLGSSMPLPYIDSWDPGESSGYTYYYLGWRWTSGGTISDAASSGRVAQTYKFALSAWCVKNGYPSAVGYFQQRMLFAGSTQYPQTVWMTKTGSYRDFGVELPGLDDDAITTTVASSQVNPIRHILALRSLLLMTSTSEWSIANSDDALTAATINPQVQSYRGSAILRPLVVGNMALVVQAKGNVVRDLGYEWSSDSFAGNDLCVMVDHLFYGHTLVAWDFAQSPFSVAWCVRDDGVLLGLTYMREHEVFAWHRHDTQGRFESICTIDEDGEDAVYVEVAREVGGQTRRYIERFAKRHFTDQLDGVFLDSSLSYDGRASNAKVTHLMGLEHLEGLAVGVVADGSVHPDCVVKDGAITLNNPATVVRVGLHYTSDLETLRLCGTDGYLFGKKTLIRSVRLLCRDTRALFAGSDWDCLYEIKQRTNESYGAPIELKTGWFDVGVSTTWSEDGRICVRQQEPLPVSILALSPEVVTER